MAKSKKPATASAPFATPGAPLSVSGMPVFPELQSMIDNLRAIAQKQRAGRGAKRIANQPARRAHFLPIEVFHRIATCLCKPNRLKTLNSWTLVCSRFRDWADKNIWPTLVLEVDPGTAGNCRLFLREDRRSDLRVLQLHETPSHHFFPACANNPWSGARVHNQFAIAPIDRRKRNINPPAHPPSPSFDPFAIDPLRWDRSVMSSRVEDALLMLPYAVRLADVRYISSKLPLLRWAMQKGIVRIGLGSIGLGSRGSADVFQAWQSFFVAGRSSCDASTGPCSPKGPTVGPHDPEPVYPVSQNSRFRALAAALWRLCRIAEDNMPLLSTTSANQTPYNPWRTLAGANLCVRDYAALIKDHSDNLPIRNRAELELADKCISCCITSIASVLRQKLDKKIESIDVVSRWYYNATAAYDTAYIGATATPSFTTLYGSLLLLFRGYAISVAEQRADEEGFPGLHSRIVASFMNLSVDGAKSLILMLDVKIRECDKGSQCHRLFSEATQLVYHRFLRMFPGSGLSLSLLQRLAEGCRDLCDWKPLIDLMRPAFALSEGLIATILNADGTAELWQHLSNSVRECFVKECQPDADSHFMCASPSGLALFLGMRNGISAERDRCGIALMRALYFGPETHPAKDCRQHVFVESGALAAIKGLMLGMWSSLRLSQQPDCIETRDYGEAWKERMETLEAFALRYPSLFFNRRGSYGDKIQPRRLCRDDDILPLFVAVQKGFDEIVRIVMKSAEWDRWTGPWEERSATCRQTDLRDWDGDYKWQRIPKMTREHRTTPRQRFELRLERVRLTTETVFGKVRTRPEHFSQLWQRGVK